MPSPPPTGQSKARRQAAYQERIAARQRQRAQEAQRQQRRRLIALGGAIIGTAVAVWLIILAIQGAAPPPPIRGVTHSANLGRKHVSGAVTYPQNPPVGGDHNAVWLNCGVYTTPVANENAVHAMEHGAVWITYQPGLTMNEVATLLQLVSGKTYVILSPALNLPAPIVASAWGVQVPITRASDARLAAFITKYANSAQAPEPGGACTNGTGTPSA